MADEYALPSSCSLGWAGLRDWTWDQAHIAFLFQVFAGLGFALVGGWFLLRGLPRLLARWKLGSLEVSFEPKVLRRDKTGSCKIRFRPRRPIDLTEATATLIATEVVTSTSTERDSSGRTTTRTGTYKHKAHEQELTLASGRQVPAGESVQLNSTLQVPPHVPCTFMAPQNRLVWSVRVDVKLSGGVEWRQEFPLVVRP